MQKFIRPSALLSLLVFATMPSVSFGFQRDYLVDIVHLPSVATEASDYAIDLNGDGIKDNRFGDLVTMLSAGTNQIFNAPMVAAISSGSIVQLLALRSPSGGFSNDPAASSAWRVGAAMTVPPLLNGLDNPIGDAGVAPSVFLAALTSGSFSSASPATTTSPVDLTLRLAFGNTYTDLPVQGAHVSFTLNGADRLQGQIHGSIRHQDYMTQVPNALAIGLNAYIQANPGDATAQAMLNAFDSGCGGQVDGQISECELTGSPLLQNYWTADVQIRDAQGNYAPNPNNTSPDAHSIGISFGAILSPADRLFASEFDL